VPWLLDIGGGTFRGGGHLTNGISMGQRSHRRRQISDEGSQLTCGATYGILTVSTAERMQVGNRPAIRASGAGNFRSRARNCPKGARAPQLHLELERTY